MPIPRPRGVIDGVDYIVVRRSGSGKTERSSHIELESPTRTQRSFTKRQDDLLDDLDSDSDDDDLDDLPVPQGMPTIQTIPTLTIPKGPPAFSMTVTVQRPDATAAPLADQDPAETLVVELVPPPRPDGREGRMSQTTEHLLIAAGSIGATIIIVLIVLALYTMRKRGLAFRDLMHPSQLRANYRAGPPPPPKYGHDSKQTIEENYAYARKNSVFPPVPAALNSRSNSISKEHTPLQTLGRSDSFANSGLPRKGSVDRSFYDDTISRSNSHRRVPSSPVLPIQTMRRSDSTYNTRSQMDEEEVQFTNMPPRIAPTPPTFRQFLSNRPSASQRPGFGNAMMSRFSWTNSNAPQTPREARDTAMQPIGRDSFMTQRSSVPRFRTVDSWVNQQSNRVEEQRLKQQFRMTQSTVYSADGDEQEQIPKVPAVPAVIPESGGLAGKNIKHQRQDTTTSVMTAPIFKVHPGTEVRFSTRSTVPSEVLDMGNRNALSALSNT